MLSREQRGAANSRARSRTSLAPSPCKSLGRPIPVAAARVGGGTGRGPSQASSVASMLRFASAVKTLAEAGKRPRMLP